MASMCWLCTAICAVTEVCRVPTWVAMDEASVFVSMLICPFMVSSGFFCTLAMRPGSAQLWQMEVQAMMP
eukprot:3402119-Pyramimonas_sp.AAC.1